MIDPFDVAADFEYPSENGVRLCQMCRPITRDATIKSREDK